jgi:hypothetical protein
MEEMLSCAEFEALLADYLDETPSAPARSAGREAFLRHRDTCAACAELAENAASALSFMERAADVEIPQELITKILQATNSGWEFKLRSRGLSGWINRTFAPVLRPRFVMSAMLTLVSLTMLTRCAPGHTLTASDLDPVHVWSALDLKAHRIWDRTMKSYESARLVYEVRNQIDDWAARQKQQDDASADARADQRQLNNAGQENNNRK